MKKGKRNKRECKESSSTTKINHQNSMGPGATKEPGLNSYIHPNKKQGHKGKLINAINDKKNRNT